MASLSPPFTCSLFFFFLLTSLSLSSSQSELQESFELTRPLPTSSLPFPSPECTLSLFNFTLNDTVPITVDYSPPENCSAPWSHAVLHFSGEVSGEQSGHLASVWLAGAEILRTSTPEPFDNGTFWNVRKDITRYSYLLRQSNVSLSMMFHGLLNYDGITDVYNVNLTILYYKHVLPKVENRKIGSSFGGVVGDRVYDKPADLVIPVSDEGYEGWFRIEDESVVGSSLMIPKNANKVVLELYVSSHGDDEFWYSNPPNKYIVANNLTTTKGNGAFREVFVKIDGNVVASEVPFPVVFPGGINPLFWEPVVAIGAFDLPSYDFDLTHVLGTLLDGLPHSFETGVTNASYFWLIGANIHVWLDKDSTEVQANAGQVKPPEFKQKTDYDFDRLDGSFEIKVKRKSYSSGWVASSAGNFTTTTEKKMTFKSEVKFKNNGMDKIVKHEFEVKTDVKVFSERGSKISQSSSKKKYPLKLTISNLPGNLVLTNISHELIEEFSDGISSTSIENSQDAGGWVLWNDNHSIESGFVETNQNLSYSDKSVCFSRAVKATSGKIVKDESSSTCNNSLFDKVLNVLLEEL